MTYKEKIKRAFARQIALEAMGVFSDERKISWQETPLISLSQKITGFNHRVTAAMSSRVDIRILSDKELILKGIALAASGSSLAGDEYVRSRTHERLAKSTTFTTENQQNQMARYDNHLRERREQLAELAESLEITPQFDKYMKRMLQKRAAELALNYQP